MFAALVLEREPMQWFNVATILAAYARDVGGLALCGLVLFGLGYFGERVTGGAIGRPTSYRFSKGYSFLTTCIWIAAIVGLATYSLGFSLMLSQPPEDLNLDGTEATSSASQMSLLLRTIGGVAAIIAVTLPILISMFTRFSWRRIWALSLLTIKEAVRSRVVLIFAVPPLVFLFADWFVPYKPEDQIRNYVYIIYLSMTPLFILTASLLGAFSIPSDVRKQSIHTIVTKPVEKFEIVLGRFVGYGVVLTIGMIALSLIGLLYIARGIHPRAAEESYKARVTTYADQHYFHGAAKQEKGESVGRVHEYRSYIAGPGRSTSLVENAIWRFDSLPAFLGTQEEPVKFEFTFDIFRLTKGQENRGVFTNFAFAPGNAKLPEIKNTLTRIREEKGEITTKLAAQKQAENKSDEWYREQGENIYPELALKYGIYFVPSVEVIDYHTGTLQLQPEYFKKLHDERLERQKLEEIPSPELQVVVSISQESRDQMLGVARRDLYLLESTQPFWLNYMKGIFGLWCTTMLVLGLAVVFSTYFSGVVSWLCAMFVLLNGFNLSYLEQVAEDKYVGGGPFESAQRIFTRRPEGLPLDDTPTSAVIRRLDSLNRWSLQRLKTVIPDMRRYNLQVYVQNGFDIPFTQVLLLDNFLALVFYLLPGFVLAYYLMQFREIANPM